MARLERKGASIMAARSEPSAYTPMKSCSGAGISPSLADGREKKERLAVSSDKISGPRENRKIILRALDSTEGSQTWQKFLRRSAPDVPIDGSEGMSRIQRDGHDSGPQEDRKDG